MSSPSRPLNTEQPLSSKQQPAFRPTPGPQRKACEQCYSIKVRCDHRRPVCSRCQKRKLDCTYSIPAHNNEDHHSERAVSDNFDTNINLSRYSQLNNGPLQIQPEALKEEQLSFSNVNLICPIDYERVRDRWLEGWAPSSDRRPKNLSPGMTFFALTVLRSYPRMLTRSDTLPPFIHKKQFRNRQMLPQLARCTNVARMWANQVSGGEEMVRELINTEMEKLIAEAQAPDINDLSRLTTLQAYLLYSLMLLPETHTQGVIIEQGVMLHLQEYASVLAQTGLLCPSEQTNDRPDWESWIIAESKRRTLFAIYMFDDVVNTLNGLPCILGDELGILPMTCSKTLWMTQSRGAWEHEYNSSLGAGKHLRLCELWIHPADTETRNKRERWLSFVDEYGMAIYSIASITQLG